jgi:hypothetical protein
VHTALPDPENSDACLFAFKECMAKPGIKEAWFEVTGYFHPAQGIIQYIILFLVV